MNTAAIIAELQRRINNLIRVGTIAEVQGALCRVKTGNVLTDWRPFLTMRAGTARTSWRPTVGEQVMLLSLSGDIANAYILPALYSDQSPEPDDHPTRHRTVYPDNAVTEYDPETGALNATGIKTATVQAIEHVTVDCPESTFTGNVLIKGNAVVEGTGTVQQKLTAQAGVEVTGSIDHNGKLTNTGGVKIDGIEFGSHKHGGVQGGSSVSGGPQ